MKNLLINADQLEKELQYIEEYGNSLFQKLELLTQEIKYIFSQIQLTENVASAHQFFDVLQRIQSTLAKLIYVDGLNLSTPLSWFVSDFERIDDNELRIYIFNKIKNHEYYFGKKLL